MTTSKYAVFGNPIAHSLSPVIHQRFAEQVGDAIRYERRLIEDEQFEQAVKQFFATGGAGLNITVPYKLRACEMADSLTPRARQAGAVNTLYMKDGQLQGDNTDGEGLCRDMRDNLGWVIARANILLIGAGGAVRGVMQPLLQQQPKRLVVVNRTEAKAQQLASLFADEASAAGCDLSAMSFNALGNLADGFDIVINGSSASLHGDLPPLPVAAVNHACCYDMMYAKTPTAFLRWAAQQGARAVADGLGMLVEQAGEAYSLWRGARPDTGPVIKALRKQL